MAASLPGWPHQPGRVGRCADANTLNGIRPLERLQTGMLFPVLGGESGLDAAEAEGDGEEDSPGDEDKAGTEAAGLSRPDRRVVPPSSVGFSFFVHGDSIEIQLTPRAVRYEPPNERDAQQRFVTESWVRARLGGEDEARRLPTPDRGSVHHWRETVFDSRTGLFVLWRPHADGWLVTVSLSNTQQVSDQHGNAELPGTPRWRPFQFAFLLQTLASTVDEDAYDRDLVDLIWFPTRQAAVRPRPTWA